ncbi:MAG: nucleotide exchange factor GrpE [Acidobacteriota bacterium]|nr:nucleotide exchange factor GrpE [Blastocatellia bacterium]MDW8240585.1 nucleotide exchange factor GrpE [Acidobacteriota bacterium]
MNLADSGRVATRLVQQQPRVGLPTRSRQWRWRNLVCLLSLLWASGPAIAQTSAPVVQLKLTNPQSITQDIGRFYNERAPTTYSIRVTTDQPDWWFIRFDKIPAGIELTIKPDEPLREGQWIPIKGQATVTLLVTLAATSPISLVYRVGRVPAGQPQPDTVQAAELLAQQNEVSAQAEARYIKLFWRSPLPTISVTPANLKLSIDDYLKPQTVTFKGDDIGWSFLRFVDIPSHIKISTPDILASETINLEPNKQLSSQQWYGFQQTLTLHVMLNKQPTEPGSSKLLIQSGQVEFSSEDRTQLLNAVRRDAVGQAGEVLVVPITWATSSFLWLAEDFISSPVGQLVALLLGLAILWVLYRYLRHRFERPVMEPEPDMLMVSMSERYSGPSAVIPPPAPTPPPASPGWWTKLTQFWSHQRTSRSPVRSPSYDDVENRFTSRPPFTGQSPAPLPPTTDLSNPSSQLTQSVQIQGRRLEDMEQKLASLETLIIDFHRERDRLAALEQTLASQTQAGAAEAVEQQISKRLQRAFDELKAELMKQQQLARAKIEGLEQAISQLVNKVREQQAHTDEHRRALEELRAQMQQGTTSHPSGSAAGASEQATGFSSESADRLYARLLGLIFGGTVNGLEQDGFEAAMKRAGETLNRFFRDDLPLAKNLQAEAERAKALVEALDNLLTKGAAMNKDVYADLRQASERARRVSREITTIQSQLQNRDITLDLHIRVSAGPSGYALFLEELGRAVKQAIDKLTDPQAYIQHQLDRLICGDVLMAVDVCDRRLAPPGENPELERALKNVFQAAHLKPIAPIAMEPFQAGEHNIVEFVAGGRPQAIARTIRRGFYYQDQLLRKADVAVYK